MKKKFVKGVAVAFLLASSLGGGVMTYLQRPLQQQNMIIVEAATTKAENRTIQTKLKRWGYYTGAIDGIYGPKTKAAVKYFQRKNGLTVDGIVGPKTAAALGMRLSSSGGSSSSSSISSSDLNLLARCVYAEARGEPYTGQVAVAAVVLNRVKSASFPNTIAGVIYQPYAFTAVDDGQINLTPNSTAYKAAQDALNGWDPTYGCLYYYNPVTATSSWIWSRKTVVTIGKHVFAL
ncbi:MAG: spore cortex-lytic enzyme [Clostridia bacterium]|nr:spore cortex-lytic enzyme [Clostridia bacterium]